MNFELNFDSKELAKLGILETFFKRKLKHYLTKKVQKSINTEQQLKIINDWKKKNSIKSNSELEQWLHLMNSNTKMNCEYFIKRKDYLDLITQ